MSLYSQEEEQEVQVFYLYFEDCFSKKRLWKILFSIAGYIQSNT